jgi:hypothetical protein
MHRPRLVIVLSLAGLLLGGLAWACTVPVFRYALERWRHDKRSELYHVTVFHKGELGEAERAKLRILEPEDGPRANWFVEAVNLDGEVSKDARELWQKQEKATLPWVVVQVPDEVAERPPLYQGPLDSAALTALMDSPVRQQIAKKLLAGDSVVWLLVESGDKDRDDAVAEQVGKELACLEKLIVLPEQDDDKESVLRSKVPLRISFPLVRMSRQGAGEDALLHQVLTLDEDHTRATGPILVPIFGRGRMLTGFPEKEITRKNLEEVARFLCGACSCRVKAANPGVDLLWRADWDSILDEAPMKEPEAKEPEPIALPKKVAEEVRPEGDGARSLLIAGISAAAALVLVTGWLALRLSRGV